MAEDHDLDKRIQELAKRVGNNELALKDETQGLAKSTFGGTFMVSLLFL